MRTRPLVFLQPNAAQLAGGQVAAIEHDDRLNAVGCANPRPRASRRHPARRVLRGLPAGTPDAESHQPRHGHRDVPVILERGPYEPVSTSAVEEEGASGKREHERGGVDGVDSAHACADTRNCVRSVAGHRGPQPRLGRTAHAVAGRWTQPLVNCWRDRFSVVRSGYPYLVPTAWRSAGRSSSPRRRTRPGGPRPASPRSFGVPVW
jgi:hypothetical protein